MTDYYPVGYKLYYSMKNLRKGIFLVCTLLCTIWIGSIHGSDCNNKLVNNFNNTNQDINYIRNVNMAIAKKFLPEVNGLDNIASIDAIDIRNMQIDGKCTLCMFIKFNDGQCDTYGLKKENKLQWCTDKKKPSNGRYLIYKGDKKEPESELLLSDPLQLQDYVFRFIQAVYDLVKQDIKKKGSSRTEYKDIGRRIKRFLEDSCIADSVKKNDVFVNVLWDSSQNTLSLKFPWEKSLKQGLNSNTVIKLISSACTKNNLKVYIEIDQELYSIGVNFNNVVIVGIKSSITSFFNDRSCDIHISICDNLVKLNNNDTFNKLQEFMKSFEQFCDALYNDWLAYVNQEFRNQYPDFIVYFYKDNIETFIKDNIDELAERMVCEKIGISIEDFRDTCKEIINGEIEKQNKVISQSQSDVDSVKNNSNLIHLIRVNNAIDKYRNLQDKLNKDEQLICDSVNFKQMKEKFQNVNLRQLVCEEINNSVITINNEANSKCTIIKRFNLRAAIHQPRSRHSVKDSLKQMQRDFGGK